jgi:predicted TIM-barrel fold metal-dependent hydrolase
MTLAFLNEHLKVSATPPRIDAHVHIGPPPPAFYEMLDRLNMRVLNVTVIDPHAPGFDTAEPQTTMAARIAATSGGRVAWAATFDPAGFEKPGFASAVAKQLQSAFDRGAVAVKIYKSVGLDLKSSSGAYVMPDDPAFAPVLDMIARSGKTLMAHLAEPQSSWKPLDPADPHYNYYKNNPDWHMFQHPERPSWEKIIAARDHMLEQHPDLRVIGCHLGSLEHDVDEIAKRLERYPNFAVDTAARVPNLMKQPNDKVRAFLIKYQDRVLWATDGLQLDWKDPAVVKSWEQSDERQWKYFAETLALPPDVLRKIFHDNAIRWIPGLGNSSPATND